MRISILCMLGALALAGCGETFTTTKTAKSSNNPAVSPPAKPREPDNTGVNKRDADGDTLTPIDQNENQRDVQITADIRKRVVSDGDLSLNAKNAKIITADGKVTLRGPINSAEEKEALGRIALSIAGEGNVTNLLEVTEN